jgi:hypothetical protein
MIILVRVRKVEVMGGRGQTAGPATAAAGAVSGREFSVAVVRFARLDEVGVAMALLLPLLNLRT